MTMFAGNLGGIVLCGGNSLRMGRSKALLPFGPESMLQRVVRIVREAASPVVVVAAARQTLPPLPDDVQIVEDDYAALGPLAGLATGLAALAGRTDLAYVTGCDAPLLRSEFIRQIAALLGDYDLALPRAGAYYHPLAAVYRVDVVAAARRLIAENRLSVIGLCECLRTRSIAVEELRTADPELLSLRNINSPADYQAALADAGLTGSSSAADG